MEAPLLAERVDWCTSDLHVGHANISRYTGRPWGAVDAMNEALRARWNAVVDPGDTVLVLGDLAMGRIKESLAFCTTFNGTKLLVPGNHDRCHPMFPDSEKWKGRYEDAGFTVLDPIIRVTLAPFEQPVLACHYPPEGESRKAREDRNVDWRPEGCDDGTPMLHGHVHDRWLQKGGLINCGMDVWNFLPAAASSIVALIKTPVALDVPQRQKD